MLQTDQLTVVRDRGWRHDRRHRGRSRAPRSGCRQAENPRLAKLKSRDTPEATLPTHVYEYELHSSELCCVYSHTPGLPDSAVSMSEHLDSLFCDTL